MRNASQKPTHSIERKYREAMLRSIASLRLNMSRSSPPKHSRDVKNHVPTVLREISSAIRIKAHEYQLRRVFSFVY